MPDSPDTPDPGYDTVPVDHDPFEDAHGQGPQGNVASSVVGTAGGLAQRAYDWWQNQPSWTERAQGVSDQAQQMREAGASEADIARATMQQRADLMGGFVGSTTPKVAALHASQNLMGDSLGKVLGVKGADMMQAGPAAARLRTAGIPGIKYFDQGSRSGGEGTRNYVVFDDSLIDILKKYSLAGLIAGGAAHFSTMPIDHDPYGDQVTPKRAQGGAIKGRRERVKEILKRNGVAA